MSECLFISGIGKFGSGKINAVILDELNRQFNPIHINTQGMKLSFLRACALIYQNDLIIFSPSVAGWSVLRDLLFYIVMLSLKKKIYVVCLCDLNYSQFPYIIKKIIESKIVNGVWSPAFIPVAKPIKLFRQHDKLKLRSTRADIKYEKTLIYGNYLERDKGFYDFIDFIKTYQIINYNAFGTTFDNSKCLVSNIKYVQTPDSQTFQYHFENHVDSNSVYFFASCFDLAPLTLLEAIAQGSAIHINNFMGRAIVRNFLGRLPDYEISFDNGFPCYNTDLVHQFNLDVLDEINDRPSIAELVDSLCSA